MANSAYVAPTAYVGLNAAVLDGAKVEGQARIEGHAVVRLSGRVKDSAVISGQAVVTERATVGGSARVGGGAVITHQATVQGDASVQEAVHVMGDGIVEGNALIKGWGEVHTSQKAPLAGDLLAGEDLEVHLSSSPVAGFKTGLFYGFMADAIFQNEVRDLGGQTASWDFSKPGLAVLDSVGDHQGVAGRQERPLTKGRRALVGGALFDGVTLDSREWTMELEAVRTSEKAGTLLKTGGFVIKTSAAGDLVLSDGTKIGKLPLNKWIKVKLSATPKNIRCQIGETSLTKPTSAWNRRQLDLRWMQLAPDFPGALSSGKLWRREN